MQVDQTEVAHKKGREELKVEGITCTNCARKIRQNLEKEGLVNIYVDISNGAISFVNPNSVTDKKIKNSITTLGYKIAEKPFDPVKKLTLFFAISAVFTIPLLLSMFLPFDFLHNPYLQLALCLPPMTIGIMHFGKSAFSSLKTFYPNMDVLILMGSSAAFVYSVIGTVAHLGHDYLFFETAATIITLILLGNLIEKRSLKKTATAINELQQLKSTTAKKLVIKDGFEQVQDIDMSMIMPGNKILINTGDHIPTDSKIIWGEGLVNESMMTGEDTPVKKTVGDQIIGGTIVEQGNFKAKVTATGDSTVLSRIIEMVKNASAAKPEIQDLGDKVSSVFVPVVIVIALGTFFISHFAFNISLSDALLRGVAVLVISCPCAMGLATPTAITVGMGRAAKNGILFKDGKAAEIFAGIKKIIFDKTGTLTSGKFQMNDVSIFNGYSEEEVKGIAKQLEQHSSHPIAKSLVKSISGQPAALKFSRIEEKTAQGIEAETSDGTLFKIGSAQFNGIHNEDHETIYLSKNNQLIASFKIVDALRPDAGSVVHYFNDEGISSVLLSGDKKEKTARLAQETGISEYFAEKLPNEKLEIIENLSKQHKVAMVGDGINDAPALTRADVGISLSDATDIAVQSASIILLKNQLSALPFSHKLSKHIFLTIKQNLFWAFFYNVIAIPLAALGFLNPMIAAFSMGFSDVMVIGNSLRLKVKKLK